MSSVRYRRVLLKLSGEVLAGKQGFVQLRVDLLESDPDLLEKLAPPGGFGRQK